MLTAYKAAQIVNERLATLGVEKVLPPQMFYNYTTARIRKGKVSYIETTTVDDKVYITEEGLDAWFVKYVEKNVKVPNQEQVNA